MRRIFPHRHDCDIARVGEQRVRFQGQTCPRPLGARRRRAASSAAAPMCSYDLDVMLGGVWAVRSLRGIVISQSGWQRLPGLSPFTGGGCGPIVALPPWALWWCRHDLHFVASHSSRWELAIDIARLPLAKRTKAFLANKSIKRSVRRVAMALRTAPRSLAACARAANARRRSSAYGDG